MTLTEIKKEIYKQQPIAYFQFIRLGVAYYYGVIKGEEAVDAVPQSTTVYKDGRCWHGIRVKFEIPINDMGNSDFLPTMEAKYLIRWIVEETEE